MSTVALRCAGCGAALPPDDPTPFRCPARRAGDDIDHVVREIVTTDPLAIAAFRSEEPNPFVRYRRFAYSHAAALAHGMSDGEYVALARALDEAVAHIDGHGFRVTPLSESAELGRAIGLDERTTLFIKDETDNVSGSHKGRHLMGVMLWLEVAARIFGREATSAPLAIASCGNAALAAAVIARAAGRRLDVFVPPHANAAVKARLEALGAHLVLCPREGAEPGDPCYLRFRGAVGEGSLPFTCQGNENGLTISGGKTLAYELVSQLASAAPGGAATLDRLFIQVGGAALASACVQGLRDALALGLLQRMPEIHVVQTEGGHPLVRAWRLLTERFGDRPGPQAARDAIAWAAHHRSSLMWPWESEPHSLAEGILDDETYDWLAVLEGVLDSGGAAWTVDEDEVAEAHRLAHSHTTIDVCPTGSAGLAGLMHVARKSLIGPGERVAVLFTGHTRG